MKLTLIAGAVVALGLGGLAVFTATQMMQPKTYAACMEEVPPLIDVAIAEIEATRIEEGTKDSEAELAMLHDQRDELKSVVAQFTAMIVADDAKEPHELLVMTMQQLPDPSGALQEQLKECGLLLGKAG